jgi:hypothetical protein
MSEKVDQRRSLFIGACVRMADFVAGLVLGWIYGGFTVVLPQFSPQSQATLLITNKLYVSRITVTMCGLSFGIFGHGGCRPLTAGVRSGGSSIRRYIKNEV